MKKLFSIILSLVMVLSFIPTVGMTASALNENTVAVIGETEYTSVFGEDGALKAAKSGETVVLVKDIKEQGGVELTVPVTLDLAGHSAIVWGTAKAITANSDITIRSTVDGKGVENTEEKANFSYSGTLITPSAKFTAENIDFHAETSFPEYDEENDFADTATYENKRWRYDDKGKELGNVDNYTRIANTTPIDVVEGSSYYFGYTTTKTDKYTFEVFLLDADGKIISKLSNDVANAMITVPIGKNAAKISYNVYCKGNEWGYNPASTKLLPLLNNKTIDVNIYKVVKTCEYDGKNALMKPGATGVEYTLKNCDVTSTNTDLSAFEKGIKFNIEGSKFSYLNANGATGFQIRSALSSGIFKDTTIDVANGNGVIINNTSKDGITFDNCTITCSGDGGRTAMTVKDGVVNFLGGAFGSEYAGNGTILSGGTVTIDGTDFVGTKGSYSLNLESGASVLIKKAKVSKGKGKSVNSNELLLKALDENIAIYSSKQFSDETIYVRERDFTGLSDFYIGECGHYCQSTQGESKDCAYCLAENANIGHKYTKVKYNETQHWYECSRCGGVSTGEDHTDKNGTAATCTEKAVCGVCDQAFGKPNGHDFKNYAIDETQGCEHNPVKVATCENCPVKDYDYSQAKVNITVIEEELPATCTEDGHTRKTKCSICEGEVIIEDSVKISAEGHSYGKEIVDEEPTYSSTGKAHKVCGNCDDIYNYTLPKKEYPAWASFAILNSENTVKTDDQLYANLYGADGALTKAKEGDTIVLLKDASVTALTEISKELTIDLMGYDLACDTPDGFVNTSKNLTLKSSSASEGVIMYSSKLVISSATLTAENINFAPTATGNLFTPSGSSAKLIAKDCIIGRDFNNSNDFNSNSSKTANDAKTHGGYVAVNAMANDGPTGTKAFKVYGMSGISGNAEKFDQSYGSITLTNIISATSKALTFKAAVKPDSATATVSAHYGLVIDGINYWSGKNKNGVINTTTVQTISVVGTTMYDAEGNEKVITADDISKVTRFLLKPCSDAMSVYADDINTDVTGTATTSVKSGLDFSTAFEYDMDNCKFYGGNFNNTSIYNFNNAELKGIIKNSDFKARQGIAVKVTNTSASGIVFENCTAISNGDSGNSALEITGGKVSFIGGTYGNKWSSYTANFTGGNITIDGTTFEASKNNMSLNLSANATVLIKSAVLKKSSKGPVNNSDLLVNALAENVAVFNSEAMDADSVYERTTDFVSKNVLYIGPCQHWSVTATCLKAGACVFCNKQYDAYGHDFTKFACDDENHWTVCSRCGEKELGTDTAHTSGTPATCTVGTICSVCDLPYGNALGHDFSKTYDCHDDEHHWKSCSRCNAHGDENEHSAGTAATCTAKAVCKDCNSTYGKPNGHEFINYTSNHDETCHSYGTKTATCENCNEEDTIPNDVLLDHVPKTVPGKPATCISSGLTDGKVCELCKDELSKQIIIPPTGHHTWDNGVITPSTCKHSGSIVYTCIYCKVKSDVVELEPALNNHLALTVNVASTYFSVGYKNRKICKDCGKVISSGSVVAKKVLATPTKTKLSGKKGKITAKYKKVTGATGFQVRYKTTGKWKTKTFNTVKAATKTVSKLKRGTYSVQLRTMVKQGNLKAFSNWTKAKKITVK